jgi:hypothetical protein
MQFLTNVECESWFGKTLPDSSNRRFTERLPIPPAAARLTWWTGRVSSALLPTGKECLLWITEWGIWTENLHLYYRLKEGYRDKQQLFYAPGHLFLDYESPDLATFLQVSIMNGWGGYLLTRPDYLTAFLSHDEFVDFFFNEEASFEELRFNLSK